MKGGAPMTPRSALESSNIGCASVAVVLMRAAGGRCRGAVLMTATAVAAELVVVVVYVHEVRMVHVRAGRLARQMSIP